MTKFAITEKATNVLNAIADGCTTRDAVAEALMTSVNTINGSLTALKRNNIIKIDDDGNIELTSEASQYITTEPPKATQPAPQEQKGQSGSPAGETQQPAPQQPGGREGSKMTAARQLFDKLVGQGKKRKDVIQSFQQEIGLTRAGAATYYQTIKHDHDSGSKGQ